MTTQKKNSRLSARAILCQMLGMLMALTVALPVSFAAADDEIPALHQAAGDGDRAEVKRLLSAGADVNAGDADGWTPLSYAVDIGDVGIIADLLAAGANVNVANASAEGEPSLLHWSARWDYPAVIDVLVKNGADINLQNGSGETALLWAAAYGRPAAARALIKGGANVDFGDNTESAPLHIAARENHDVVMDILIANGANLHSADEHGYTPLHDAAWFGNLEAANMLINAGADTSGKNNEGRTPLYYAQDRGHNDVADALIEANEDYDVALPPEAESVSERVFEKVWRSIVYISDDEGQGSGVIVGPETVATNCHVVEGGEIIVRKAHDRRIDERDAYRATIRDGNRGQDFCLLDVSGLDGVPVKIRLYNTLRVGEDVYAVGNPDGLDLSLSAGIISQLREEGEGGNREIQTDATTTFGSSGGGLFDKNGNLVGITTAILEGEGDINFAIPADWFFGY